jgi:hypothetical protein
MTPHLGIRMPSASRLQLAATCPASQVLPAVREESSAYAEEGRAKHAYIAAIIDGVSATEALMRVPAEWRDACRAFDAPAIAEHLVGMGTELALAYDVETGRARIIGRHIGREYGTLDVTEIAMALDYDVVRDGVAHVVDLKTGHGRTTPLSHNWQLRAHALALARASGADDAIVGLVLAPGNGEEPSFPTADIDAFELAVVADELRALWRRLIAAKEYPERYLTLGDHCRYCRARFSCPAQVGLVRELAGSPTQWGDETRALLTPELAGKAYARLKTVRRLLDGMESVIYAMAREAPIYLGDGVELREVRTEREYIDGDKAEPILSAHGLRDALEYSTSKAAIRRACDAKGKAGAAGRAREIVDKLRAAGAVLTNEATTVRECESKHEVKP